MDVRSGAIKALSEIPENERQHFIEMQNPPTPKQQRIGKVGRNELCPCGSGKKFKHCHLNKVEK